MTSEKATIFVRFSKRIPNSINISDEFLKLNSLVKSVRKPRKNSARWVLVDCDNLEDAEIVKKELFEKKMVAGLRVKHHKLNVKLSDETSVNSRKKYLNSLTKKSFQSEKFLDKYSNKLLVTQLPDDITKDRLIKHFPDNLEINFRMKPMPKAIISYSSAKEAMEARINADKQIDGKEIRVIMLLLKNDVQDKHDFSKNTNPLKKKTSKESPSADNPPKKGRYYEKS